MTGFLKERLRALLVRLHRRLSDVVDDPYRRLRGRYGEGVILGKGSSFVEVQGIRIGDWVYIGPGARMSGSGGLSIGSNVAIGPDVSIYTSNHRYEGSSRVPCGPELDRRPVTIEDHVWIGGNVVIVPGVTVHEGAVVAAGAVVTKDVPRCAVVGGNPAEVLKWRDAQRFEELVKQEKFWVRELKR